MNARTSARIIVALLAGAAIVGTHPSARASAARDLRTVIDDSGKALGAGTLAATRGWTYHGIGMEAGLPRSITVWVDPAAGAEAIDVVSPPVSRNSGYDGHDACSRTIRALYGYKAVPQIALRRSTVSTATPMRFGGRTGAAPR